MGNLFDLDNRTLFEAALGIALLLAIFGAIVMFRSPGFSEAFGFRGVLHGALGILVLGVAYVIAPPSAAVRAYFRGD